MTDFLLLFSRSPLPGLPGIRSMENRLRKTSRDGALRIWADGPLEFTELGGGRLRFSAEPGARGLRVHVTHDAEAGSLVVRRDRVGAPAVYFAPAGNALVIGTALAEVSRTRAVFGCGDEAIDDEALALYFAYQYVPAPWTIRRGVAQLRAGARLEAGNGGAAEIDEDDFAHEATATRSLYDVGTEAIDGVERAARQRLEGARAVAALLSGGMDTSTNVAVLTRRLGLRPTLYTASFEEAGYDESEYARIAQHFLYDAVERAGHDALVTGEGADEILGYPRARDGGEDLQVLPSEPLELARFYLQKTCLAPKPLRRELCRDLNVDPELPARVLERIYWRHQGADPFERIHIGQWRTWMVHGVYVKDARLGHGRNFGIVIPFMNDDLMRTVARLPLGIKRDGLADKAFLKAAQRGVLPTETLAKKKQKFWLPFAEWFRGPWRELLHDALLDRAGFVAGRIDPTTVRRLLSEHQAGADHGRVLWALLFLEFWQKGARI